MAAGCAATSINDRPLSHGELTALYEGLAALASTMGSRFLADHYRLRARLEARRGARREEARFVFVTRVGLRGGRVFSAPARAAIDDRPRAVMTVMSLKS